MSQEVRVTSTGPADTGRLGQRIGRFLRPGDVILLSGELGAGKTVLVQGIARGLGYEGPVSSKSFVLLGEYSGRIKLYHADLYRLEEPEQAEELALDEICSDGALVVEWPERAEHIFSPDHLLVRFEITGESERVLTLSAWGERAEEMLKAIGGARSARRAPG